MTDKSQIKTNSEFELLDKIKRLAVIAMFSDDDLLDILVLKGGNALDLIHRLSARASVDLDFSMQHDFTDNLEDIRSKIERTLVNTFKANDFMVFDVKALEKPNVKKNNLKHFWGGYAFEFKIIDIDKYNNFSDDINQLRRNALKIGQGTKFLIDISRFESTLGKQEKYLEDVRIFVYSPEMIACEKLRAICQQMKEYSPIVNRSGREGSSRARDFIDIHILVDTLKLDMTSQKIKTILIDMFNAKKVPLNFLGNIGNYREFHRESYASVKDTIKAGVTVHGFDFYFDYVLQIAEELKFLWDK